MRRPKGLKKENPHQANIILLAAFYSVETWASIHPMSVTISRLQLLWESEQRKRGALPPLLNDADVKALRELDAKRPKTRADCKDGVRPCPYLSCKFNLLLDVAPFTVGRGNITLNIFNKKESDDTWSYSGHTCTLDMADKGSMMLEDIGTVVGGMTREGVRQIETRAMAKLRKMYAGTRKDETNQDAWLRAACEEVPKQALKKESSEFNWEKSVQAYLQKE